MKILIISILLPFIAIAGGTNPVPNAQISGSSTVTGTLTNTGLIQSGGTGQIIATSGSATTSGSSVVSGSATVSGSSVVSGSSIVSGSSVTSGSAAQSGTASYSTLSGSSVNSGSSATSGSAAIAPWSGITGTPSIVNSIGGTSGAVLIGSGLSITSGTLNTTAPANPSQSGTSGFTVNTGSSSLTLTASGTGAGGMILGSDGRKVYITGSAAGNIVSLGTNGSAQAGNPFAVSQCLWVRDSYSGATNLNLQTELSTDGITWIPYNKTASVSGTFNDPDIYYDSVNQKYYMANTIGTSNSGSFAIYSSPDRSTWTILTNYAPSISGTAGIWVGGPKWFRDPGSVDYTGLHLLFSMETSGTLNQNSFVAETHPTSQALSAYSAAVKFTGTFPNSYSDGMVLYNSGTYELFYCNRSLAIPQIQVATSTALTGPYALSGTVGISSDDTESPFALLTDGFTTRVYVFDVTTGSNRYLESGSGVLSGWSAPVGCVSPWSGKGASIHKITDLNEARNLITTSLGSIYNYITNVLGGSFSFSSIATPAFTFTSTDNADFQTVINMTNPNLGTNKHTNITFGTAASTNNQWGIEFYNVGAGSTSNMMQFDFFGQSPWMVGSTANHMVVGGTTAQSGAYITVNGGNVAISSVGNTLTLKGGSNAMSGTFALASGTATVASTAIDSNTVVVLSVKTASGTLGTGTPEIQVQSGTGFTASGAATDNSTYNWAAFKVNQ